MNLRKILFGFWDENKILIVVVVMGFAYYFYRTWQESVSWYTGKVLVATSIAAAYLLAKLLMALAKDARRLY